MESLIASLTVFILDSLKEVAREESKGVIANWLNKDIESVANQILFNASSKYLENYQERHGTLKVSCAKMNQPIKLDEIYTPVQLLKSYSRRYFESPQNLEEQYRKGTKQRFDFHDSDRCDGIQVVIENPFLMVLGGPGVGKSTFLRKIGLEALKGQEWNVYKKIPKNKISKKEMKKRGRSEEQCEIKIEKRKYIPVFVSLQNFKSENASIGLMIAKEFRNCGFPDPIDFTKAMLNKGKLLILLDGLDEVPQDYETMAIQKIQDFVSRYGDNRYVASCRTAGYKGGFKSFVDISMAEFDDKQILDFIQKWFSSEKDVGFNTANQCWSLLKSDEYQASRELARTPLLLTLLCGVYDKLMDFPNNRASLYGEALNVILREWNAEKRIERKPIYKEFSIELEKEFLADIAYDSFSENNLFFSKKTITNHIKNFLTSNLNAPRYLNSEEVLEGIEVHHGILVERVRETYSFSHLTFQEYLTAQYIIDNDKIAWVVENHLQNERWREVFLLASGMMFGRKGADNLLSLIGKEINTLMYTLKKSSDLLGLLEWAEKVESISIEDEKSGAAKRAIAIYIAFSYAKRVASETSDTLDRLCELSLSLAISLDSNFYRDSERLFILKSSNLAQVIDRIDCLSVKQPSTAQSIEQRISLADDIRKIWSDTLELQDSITSFLPKEDELNVFKRYALACELVIRCKEGAVRVTPQTWENIESRILSPVRG